ncbi:hypothetical protein ACQ4PT_070656 [Festuca glaucescens]
MNLTAVTDEAEVMTRHVADSLAVLSPLERAYTSRGGDVAGISLIDVGSGAGLPGLILAVARPSWKFTLLESMRKRCTFLEHAVEVMELSNVDVVCDRAERNGNMKISQLKKFMGSMFQEICFVNPCPETLPMFFFQTSECHRRHILTYLHSPIGQNVGQSDDFREAFDVAAARAVAELKVLAEYCLPLVRVGGLFVAAKGHDPHEEIRSAKAAVRTLGASMLDLCNVESVGPHGQRTAVVYLKERTTPKKYPRHPGTPSKAPL